MAKKNRRSHALLRYRYYLYFILLCGLLVFAIVMIGRQAFPEKTPDVPDTPDPPAVLTDASVLPTDPPAAEVSEAPETSVPDPTDAPPETAAPAAVSGTAHITPAAENLYVRIGRSHDVPVIPAGVGRDALSYAVTDPNICDVDEHGKVTGFERGSCEVIVTCGEEEVRIPVHVRELTVGEDGCTYVDGILIVNKSYSLPETYDPGLLPVTQEAFDRLSADAAAQGLNIYRGSDYRSYSYQVKVYQSMCSGYSKEYADSVSARPGHSEHQSGYAIDCNTIENGFAETPEGQWLKAHCHEYGFIIRFPEGREDVTGYTYESWHIRYVGEEVAREIMSQDLTLEEYLDVPSVYDLEEE